jgi:hypothetical protein
LLPNEKQLDPAGVVMKRLKRIGREGSLPDHYAKTITKVVERQNQLIGKYHGATYVAYGEGGLDFRPPQPGMTTESNDKGGPTIEKGDPTKSLLTWGNAIWTGDVPSDVQAAELQAAKLLHDSGKGEIRVFLERRKLSVTFAVQKTSTLPDVNAKTDWTQVAARTGIIRGDGTVPVWSADAQARGLKPDVPGDPVEGVQMAFVQGGYQHMNSYAHSWTHWALLYSVVQIVNDI